MSGFGDPKCLAYHGSGEIRNNHCCVCVLFYVKNLTKENQTLQEQFKQARLEAAWLVNRFLRENITEACDGDWDRCWCASCESRRRLIKSRTIFTPYEVYLEEAEAQKKRLA